MQVEKLFASGDGLRDWGASLNGNALHKLEVSLLIETLSTHEPSPQVRQKDL